MNWPDVQQFVYSEVEMAACCLVCNSSPTVSVKAWCFLVQNILLVEKVDQLAKAKGVTPGQLALAWVHSQGEDVFPIPGTKRIKYLEENAAAAQIKLTAQDKAQLEAVFAADQVYCWRTALYLAVLCFEVCVMQ